ncbi:hypothetical protein [Microvirga antarctica]|uniref:hypothetical protein n=1 Tax=Microvirga antarctica TaxID=2819233 RepID=UPI001B309B04|nr:hypothetical protein [Microvirga antarctica]
MLSSLLVAFLLAGSALSTDHWGLGGGPSPDAPSVAAARFDADARQISNWRSQSAATLEPRPVAVAAALLGADRPVITRCVKLNNYWCIKSARWDGEIGKDGEGHTAFASAERGADAAATLLRRYYLEFGRKSALDIVRRWAPAECNLATGIGGLAVLAVKGIGGTVRARYLASRKGKGVTRFTATARGGKAGRVSMVIDVKTPQYRVPDIAEGMGEKPKPVRPPRTAARTATSASAPGKPSSAPTKKAAVPAAVSASTACAPDEQRLRNYAARMVEELGLGPTDDLKLFSPDGSPQANLAAVMRAMSSVELGILRASPELVDSAIRRMSEKLAQATGTQASP